ncbi:MAG: hypothetical protein ACLUE9_09290 [Hominenteromicrobium sp.]|uniref:hypothetical protein n=1 Tax=Hominenteromicrobium sp. TaxID=3073581 RepID=UPI0039969841
MLQDYGVIAAPQKVEVSLGLPQVPIQAHTGMCEHDRLYGLAVTFTEFRCPGRNIVDKGMAVADKKNFHGITPFPSVFTFMIAYVRPKSRDFSQDYKSCVVELVAAGGKSDDAVALSRVNGTAEQGAFLCCCEPFCQVVLRYFLKNLQSA